MVFSTGGELWRPEQHIIEVAVTFDQLQRALDREAFMREQIIKWHGKEHLNNSIKSGYGVFTGLLGEEIIHDFWNTSWQRSTGEDIYHWDLRHPVLGTIDIKTKLQTYDEMPKGFYNCTVCEANTNQRCNWYGFVRVHANCERAWILGFLPKRYFLENASKDKKGDIDPTSHNDWRYKWDCRNLPISRTLAAPRTVAAFAKLQEAGKALSCVSSM